MITREYQLVDLETIRKINKSESKENFLNTKYTTAQNPHDPFSPKKIWEPKPKSEISILPNERLIDYCLEFSFECVTDPNYLGEIQLRNRKDKNQNAGIPGFSSNLQTKIQKIEEETYFGCYCRKEPNLSIYQNCPIDQFGLDSICKRKNDCLTNVTNEKRKRCQTQFKEDLYVLLKTKESKDQIHQNKDNFDRMIFYTKKFWAMEVLKELGESIN
ncbi:hypothetical protein ND861_12200 [Leptospira sp. 2 VSF19]|uniref:Uncharacterized protein n=1 Tax=Leptospira soteropolitanensis TaxID=2950025 RepID=A0AAW5VLH7_9LEPT|nr:hypothetical protein [Leptospira soteropolitanensis]MCW7493400.1 hypothetical protein [Leptospira soteropolitanensis]MCW7501068.1 hypothetical protein [Leptospira soteropolitanensis]MCW7523252.1 hypothetical protein [Leptospira soteropolitanensis]MCW7527113.1 hypothetical protein [Leptospira soteropolitanensis]MCW7530970.1 hypothetical protein [Leptospira soteropolitanensis]